MKNVLPPQKKKHIRMTLQWRKRCFSVFKKKKQDSPKKERKLVACGCPLLAKTQKRTDNQQMRALSFTTLKLADTNDDNDLGSRRGSNGDGGASRRERPKRGVWDTLG